jgi:hypothetical protein
MLKSERSVYTIREVPIKGQGTPPIPGYEGSLRHVRTFTDFGELPIEILRHQQHLQKGTNFLNDPQIHPPASFEDKNNALQQKILTLMLDLVKPPSIQNLVDLKSDMHAPDPDHPSPSPIVLKINRLSRMLTVMSPTSNPTLYIQKKN